MNPTPCIICGFQPEPVIEGRDQPQDAVHCVAVGNYGSKVWDNLFGQVKDFNICDECFEKKAHLMTERPYRVGESL